MLASLIQKSLATHDSHVNAETVRWLNAHQGDAHEEQLTVSDQVINHACLRFGERREDVLGNCRRHELCVVRKVIVRTLYDVAGMSFAAIGKVIRDGVAMDHTAVQAAYRMSMRLKGPNREALADVMALAKELK